ncbi:uncharacterized protein ARMOST_12188 [Armillaria ostoyae]|uniref:Uncharacterized protein n=1 Tax=Armillaria ostoyae TaxID=47428 RepID=A0A284RJD5_ARMOS|nr:uncharacterized protein ARMOST_12188 [Armillaria ostoyae]
MAALSLSSSHPPSASSLDVRRVLLQRHHSTPKTTISNQPENFRDVFIESRSEPPVLFKTERNASTELPDLVPYR